MQSSAIPTPVPLTETPHPPRPRTRSTVRALYAFDDCPPDRMIRICHLLQKRGYCGDSAVYVMPHSGRFYLTVEERPPTADQPFPPTLLLEEFGTRIASASMLCCLCEHAKCLCEHDAVAVLAALTM
ncbi:MAG: adaptor protein MecA [Ruminococcaceae bacterium]|nr:adaptor protein MecA [Oscillospiraceae bacterium]